jgi:hypothetical protein
MHLELVGVGERQDGKQPDPVLVAAVTASVAALVKWPVAFVRSFNRVARWGAPGLRFGTRLIGRRR